MDQFFGKYKGVKMPKVPVAESGLNVYKYHVMKSTAEKHHRKNKKDKVTSWSEIGYITLFIVASLLVLLSAHFIRVYFPPSNS